MKYTILIAQCSTALWYASVQVASKVLLKDVFFLSAAPLLPPSLSLCLHPSTPSRLHFALLMFFSVFFSSVFLFVFFHSRGRVRRRVCRACSMPTSARLSFVLGVEASPLYGWTESPADSAAAFVERRVRARPEVGMGRICIDAWLRRVVLACSTGDESWRALV